MSLRVREEGERQTEVRDLCRGHNRLTAQFLCFRQVFGGIVDLDIEADRARSTVLGRSNATTDALGPGLNKAVAGPVPGVLDLPVEQAAVELLELRAVLARDFEPGDCRLCNTQLLQ